MAVTTRVVERSRARACVPLAQLLALHGLALLVGAREEDVLVAHLRRLHPDVHVLEAKHARPLQVGHEDRVVHRASMLRRLRRRVKVADRVEVRDVDAVRVRLGAVGAVLLMQKGQRGAEADRRQCPSQWLADSGRFLLGVPRLLFSPARRAQRGTRRGRRASGRRAAPWTCTETPSAAAAAGPRAWRGPVQARVRT